MMKLAHIKIMNFVYLFNQLPIRFAGLVHTNFSEKPQMLKLLNLVHH